MARFRREPTTKDLGRLEHAFATQFIKQWLDKRGLREKLLPLKNLTLKEVGRNRLKLVREWIQTNYKQLGWSEEERRRWKRAAVLIMRQL